MALTLNTLDHAYDEPDAATVAKTLADLDGRRNLVATLARGEATYLQASGRSEERRVGKECEDLCRSRWSPYH